MLTLHRNPIRRFLFMVAAFLVTAGVACAGDIKVLGVEITQATQCFDTSAGYKNCADNSLELDMDRATAVRVYVVHDGACPSTVTGASITLRYGATHTPDLPFTPTDTRTKTFNVPCNSGLNALRDSQTGAVNFLLSEYEINKSAKSGWTNMLVAIAEVTPPSGYTDTNSSNNTGYGSAMLVPHSVLDIRYALIDYKPQGKTYTPSIPSASVAFLAPMLMEATYPVPVKVSKTSTITYNGVDDVMLNANSSSNGVMLALGTAKYALKPEPDFLFGWLAKSVQGIWSNWGGSAGSVGWGVQHNTDVQNGLWDDWTTFAHEVGHKWVGLHVNESGCISTIGEAGYPSFITTTTGAPWVHKSTTNDYMQSGAVNGWISPYVWAAMLGKSVPCPQASSSLMGTMSYSQDITPRPAATIATVEQPAMWIAGVLTLDGKGALAPIYAVPDSGPFDVSDPAGQYCLDFVAMNGSSLGTHCFNVSFVGLETPGFVDSTAFTFRLPVPEGTASVALKKGTALLDTRSASSNEPAFSSLPSATGTGILTVAWSAGDLDGDLLEYIVQYSPDGGSSWVPLGTRLQASSLTVDSSELAGGSGAVIRVLATDGFNTTLSTSAPFAVERKTPTALILRGPRENALFRPEEDIYFYGSGNDPEDGALKGSSLVWFSETGANLAEGPELVLHADALTTGAHTVTLRATDSDGNAAVSETRTIFVNAAEVYATCDPIAGQMRRKPGETFEVNLSYVNNTSSNVQFTSTMAENKFFGPAHVASSQLLEPDLGVKQYITYSTAGFATGSDRILIQAASDATGDGILAACDFELWIIAPPVAEAGANQTVECDCPAGRKVVLDGSGSSDPDGGPATLTWSGPFSEGGGSITGVMPAVTLPLGTHTITLTMTDVDGQTSTDTVSITVRDTTAPVLKLTRTSVTVIQTSAAGAVVDVIAASGPSATDVCDPAPAITHNGPAVFPVGRTEVTITATDASGNTHSASFVVNVAMHVAVDLKPGSDPNCIKLNGEGRIAFAILGESVAIASIDTATLLAQSGFPIAGGVPPLRWSKSEDVNGGGVNDLVVSFSAQALAAAGLLADNTMLYISGKLNGGIDFVGWDKVNLAGGLFCH